MAEESSGTSRGEFLKRTAGVTGLVIGAGVMARGAQAASQADPPPDAAAAAVLPNRTFSSGHFSLELDGQNVGLINSFEGGDGRAGVIVEAAGASYFSRKHVGSPEYEDFTIEFGLANDQALYGWIEQTLTGQHTRRNGAIVMADFANNAKARRTFTDALISEVAFPAMDASSKGAGFMTVKLTTEFSETLPAQGKVNVPLPTPKAWQASNFKLEIDGGIDTSRVAKVDAFTIKQGIVRDQIGDVRDPVKQPGKLEFPNLTVTLSAVGSESWFDWFEDFVIQGNNSNADERNGTLRFLAPNLKDELGQVRFFNLGIFAIGAESMGGGTVQRVVAELYCERMELGVA